MKTAYWIHSVVLVIFMSLLVSCEKKQGDSIVIPPGAMLIFSTKEFLKHSDANLEVKLRKLTEQKTLQDVTDMTPSDLTAAATTTEYKFIVPKSAAIDGLMVVDLNSKSNSLNWKAFVLDPSQVIEPTVETTLLYDLIVNYPDKTISSYSKTDLLALQEYINTFSKQRRDLFGLDSSLKPLEYYRFVKNGLSSDTVFLGKLQSIGLKFNFNNLGEILAQPYPFGRKNNRPLIEEERSTMAGAVGAYEMTPVEVRLSARDPDIGDPTFMYFEFIEDGSMLKGQKKWTWLPDYSSSRTEPYLLRAFVSDGSMEPIVVDWQIEVADNNRPPVIVASCPEETTEGETWSCLIEGSDPDPDDILKLRIASPNFPNVWPTVNGAPYTDGLQVTGRRFEIRWKPNNRDFLKDNLVKSIQFVLSDFMADGTTKKNGDSVKLATIKLIGRNRLPVPVAGPAGTLNWNLASSGNPRVLDANFTNLPFDADTRTIDKRFEFEVVLIDEDNTDEPNASLRDTHSLRLNAGTEYVRAEPSEDANRSVEIRTINGRLTPVSVFRYSWQPTVLSSNVVVSFTPFDDMQNGQGQDFSINLTAEPRAEIPSCAALPSGSEFALTLGTTTVPYSVSCAERSVPTIVQFSLANLAQAAALLPHMLTRSGAKALSFVRKVGATQYSRSEQSQAVMHDNTIEFYSKFAGTVRFARTGLCDINNPPSTTITIPAGTQVRTVYAASPYVPRISFQTTQAVTLQADECEVLVPVSALSRSASANALSKIDPMLPSFTSAGLTVGHTSTINYETTPTANVTFRRTNTSSSLTIPARTTVRTNEAGGTASIVYIVPTDVVMPVGQTSQIVTLARDYSLPDGVSIANSLTHYDRATGLLTSRIAPNSVVWAGTAISGLTVSNPLNLMPRAKNELATYKNSPPAKIPFSLKFIDGVKPLANEISQIVVPTLQAGTEAAPATSARSTTGFADLRIRNPAWINSTSGEIEIYRSVAGPTINIPVGLVVATADRKLYRTTTSGTIGASNTLSLTAERVYETAYQAAIKNQAAYFRSGNTAPQFRNFPASTQISPNQETAFKIEITDYPSSVFDPRDPLDRYYLAEYKVSSGPTMNPSNIQACRESAGACTPCVRTPASPAPTSDPYTVLNLGSLSHEESRFCYFRVTPSTSESAQTFKYNLKACDYGQSTTNAEGCVTRDLTFYVLEANTQPYFTVSNGTSAPGAPVGGAGADASPTLGSATSTPHTLATNFIEGQRGEITLYAYDRDKDSGNKTLTFEVLPQIYHLKPSDQVYIPTPAGLMIDATSIKNTALSGSGNLASAKLVWQPTDADAKRLSSTEGFIVGIRVFDNKANASRSSDQTIYYKVIMDNTNNTPVISSIGSSSTNTYTINADTYFSQTFSVTDLDSVTPYGGTFQTLLGACINADGSRRANSYFDNGNSNPSVCHLTGPEWGSDSFDPLYTGNSHVAQCRSGAHLNQDLAAPKITMTSGPSFSGTPTVIRYDFKIEWCPQKGQLGEYAIGIQVFDNGDTDVGGSTSARKGGSAPLYLNVVAPVFLTSPQMDETGTVTLKSIRQTAADLTSYPFTYQTIVQNSKGNPLQYSILSGPPGASIDATGLITWLPDRSQITDGGVATNKKIVIQVRDTVTGEYARGNIDLWVQDPTAYPGEQGPSIQNISPSNSIALSTKEMTSLPFTVVARDPNIDNVSNHDRLFAQMYIDGIIREDAEMTRIGSSADWTTTFMYRPSSGDASVDVDANGPTPRGRHVITIVVTDGNMKDSRQWIVDVRNSIPITTLAFDLPAERKAIEPASTITFSNYVLSTETAASSTIMGNNYETLFLSGSYVRKIGTASATKYYVWALDFVNDTLTKSAAGGKWNFNENLNWGTATRRIATQYDPVTSTNLIYLTNQNDKYGTFTSTSNAITMSGDLSRYSNPLPSTIGCSNCGPYLYYNEGYGHFLSVQVNNNRTFYVPNSTAYPRWDKKGDTTSSLLAGWPSGYRATGMAVNHATKRLYISATKSTMTENRVVVYNIAPTLATTPSAPVKLSEINVSATAGWSIQAPSLPGNIAIDSSNTRGRTTHRVLVYLHGTGGLAVINDNGSTTPTTFSTVGVGSLPSSSTDVFSSGARLVYDPKSDLFWGISKEARVVYSIDPTTFEIVEKPAPAPLNTVLFTSSGTAFFVDRDNSAVYVGK